MAQHSSKDKGSPSSRHHHKGHHRKKKNSEKARKRKIIIVCAIFILVAVAAYLLATLMDLQINEKAVSRDTVTADTDDLGYARGKLYLGEDSDDVYLYYHNFENYLIMGTDVQGKDNPGMADFLLLMSIDKTEDTYSLLEINRDTITTFSLLDEKGSAYTVSEGQICMAHSYAHSYEDGCRNQVTAVSDLLGELPISGYYSVSMDDIGRINHAFGGVTVTMDEDLTSLDPAMKKGAEVTLTDEQAEKYLRARMSVGEGTNEERIHRQRNYLESFLKEGEKKVRTSARHYYDIFEEMESFAVTNLTGKQISRIAKALTQNTFRGFFSFEGRTESGDEYLGDGLMHAEFYPDQDSIKAVLTDIFGLVYDPNGVYEAD
jgi:LCP family protein required for cell wall assembly